MTVKHQLNSTMDVTGGADTDNLSDNNIGVIATAAVEDDEGNVTQNGKLEIKLAKELSGLTSVTTETTDSNGNVTSKTVQDGNGLTITPTTLSDGKTAVSLTGSGLDNGGNTITNVAAGVNDTDAVNVSQLNAVKTTAGQHSTVAAGSSNITVDTGTDETTGGKKYTVDLAKDVTFGTNDKQVAISGTNGTVTVGQNDHQVKLDGTDGSITTGSTAINGTGITANQAVIGGSTTIDSTGVSTNKVAVGTNTTLNDGSATIGNVKINGEGENDGDSQHTSTVSGLSNTTFDTTNTAQYANSTRAATEAQLKTVYEAAAKGASTVTVNSGNSAGNLSLTTKTNDNGSTNYDISLSNNVTIGSTGTNGQSGTLTVTSADGTKSVTTDGEKGQLTFEDGSNTASLKAAAASSGVDGSTSINRVAVDNHAVATLDDGLKFAGDSGEALKQTLNSTTNIKGGVADTSKLADNNIGVVSDGNNTLTVKLAKDLQGLNSVNTTALNATTVNSTDVNATNVSATNVSATNVKAATVTADTVNGSTFNAGNTAINNSGLTVKSNDGSRVLTVQDGNVSMAGNQIHNVAAGTADDDAVNVSQLKKMGGEISNVSRRVDRVGAGAAALAALHPQDFDPDDKWDFAVGYGNYRGANAAAVGAFYQPNEDTTLSIGGTVGGGEDMINAGISFKFGQGNHVTNSRVAMAKEILALKDYVEKQDAEIQQLKAMVGSPSGQTQQRSLLFPDVPENHWAYSYIKKLADRGLLEGYPDGEFKGDRTMTRYEFAAMFERALENGAAADTDLQHMASEFAPEIRELSLNRFRVDRVSGDDNDHNKVERVRVNSCDEVVQQKNGETSTVYRDSYGGQIEKSAEAAK